jgi:hypothetical protein
MGVSAGDWDRLRGDQQKLRDELAEVETELSLAQGQFVQEQQAPALQTTPSA